MVKRGYGCEGYFGDFFLLLLPPFGLSLSYFFYYFFSYFFSYFLSSALISSNTLFTSVNFT